MTSPSSSQCQTRPTIGRVCTLLGVPRPTASRHVRPAIIRALSLAAVASLLSFVGGCAKPLLSPNEERSQYDRYDRVRNQYASQYMEDEYGRRQPNLRGRLGPKRN